MSYNDIAIIITAIAQLVGAVAAVICAYRGVP